MQSKSPFEFTLNMENMLQDKLSELKSYYCREDIELALNDVKTAKKDSYKFRFEDLKRLCDARGINAENLINDNSLLGDIPTRVQMQEDLLQAFYDMYLSFPKSTDFMERIVRRLAPEYSTDTVRVAILKKFLIGAGEKFKRFNIEHILAWGKKRCSEDELSTYNALSPKEQRELIVSKIDEAIFEYAAVELTSLDIFRLITNRLNKCQEDEEEVCSDFSLDEKTLIAFDDFLKMNFLYAEGASICEKMKSVESAIDEGKLLEDVAIKQLNDFIDDLEYCFMFQMKNMKCKLKTGKMSTVAEVYKQNKKDAKKKAASDWELLKLCNDLSCGNFRTNGKTKVYLYYFAIVFGMTVSLEGRPYDAERDIVKNLFQDYYNDNLLRILEGDYTNPDMVSSFEKEPTGEGINYKSFVESIYLYFICHDELEMTPGERIDAAEAVIERCVKKAHNAGVSRKLYASEHTQVYKNQHINILLNKNIDEIADYVVENYLVVSPDNSGAARIMIGAEENTAFDLISEIMEDLDSAYPDFTLFEVKRRDGMAKEIKEDIKFSYSSKFDWKIKELLDKRYAEDRDFLRVVAALDDRLHITTGRFSKSERERIIVLLNDLILFSKESEALSMYKLQSWLEGKGIVSGREQISNALAVLRDIGYDIQRRDDKYYLGKRNYDDEALNDFLSRVSGRYLTVTEKIDIMFTDLLIRCLRSERRVTRSELIAVHFNYYIALLNESVDIDTFPDVFEDYASAISPILEEARYQPLSEKNILDMYVVTALYFYLVENKGYM